MSVFYYFWEIWLQRKESEKGQEVKICAELPKQNTVKNNKDIAAQLAKEGVDVSYSTLTYIIDQYDRVVRNMICEGYTVETNNVCITPELPDDLSINSLTSATEKYQCSVKYTPSKEMRSALSFVGIKVMGFIQKKKSPSLD